MTFSQQLIDPLIFKYKTLMLALRTYTFDDECLTENKVHPYIEGSDIRSILLPYLELKLCSINSYEKIVPISNTTKRCYI